MREISQADTPTGFGGEKNPPIFVYDCSGPYTDPTARIDIRSGLPALRQRWIEERGDTEVLPDLTSEFGRARAADPSSTSCASPACTASPAARCRARTSRRCTTPARDHHPRDGIRRDPREREPRRLPREPARTGPMGEKMAALLGRQHKGQDFGASIPAEITPEFVPEAPAAAPSSPTTSTTPRASR
jgi:phosphomethylpyrimidine synthase